MFTGEKYKKELAFVKKIEHLTSNKLVFIAYFIAFSACLAAHILYFVLFAATGIIAMAAFNIFSVIFYSLTIYLVPRVKDRGALVYATLIEIIAHATAATICVGYEPDFGMFLLMIIPISLLMPNKRKKVAIIIMAVSVLIYGILRYLYLDPGLAIYTFEKSSYNTVFYVINIFSDSFILVYVTTIYTIINRYTECKLNVQNEQLRILASTDPLTKLSNRREMNKRLADITAECKASGKTYVVGIGDIDDFKKVNDTYGHDVGDTVLSTISAIIADSIPERGHVARWGGEEFLFVIPDADISAGADCAEKLISSIRRHEFTHNGSVFSITMTFGTCEGQPEDIVGKVISHADDRLYKGKHSGKNCVISAD